MAILNEEYEELGSTAGLAGSGDFTPSGDSS